MSRATRRQKTEQRLRLLEAQFTETLIAALKDCASGRRGIFGQNDKSIACEPPSLGEILKSKDAEFLLAQGEEIVRLRRDLGVEEEFPLLPRYLFYRQLRSSNTPGEPKLALEFLTEIEIELHVDGHL